MSRFTPAQRARFATNVRRSPGCWTWLGGVTKERGGYGVFYARVDGKTTFRAHRVAFELRHNRLPRGEVLRHSCDNPLCVNPDHLVEGSHRDNVADAIARRRYCRGERHHASKLTTAKVSKMRALRRMGASLKKLAWLFGVSVGNVSMICAGKRWAEAS